MCCRPNYDHDQFFNAFRKEPRDLATQFRRPIRCRDKAVLTELAGAVVEDRALLRGGCTDESAIRNTGKMESIELIDVLWALETCAISSEIVAYDGEMPSSSVCRCRFKDNRPIGDDRLTLGGRCCYERADDTPCCSTAPPEPKAPPPRKHRNRDELLAKHNLPIPASTIIEMTQKDFLSMLKSDWLSPKQKMIVRLIRKRGKNKAAARRCRARQAQTRGGDSVDVERWEEEEEDEEGEYGDHEGEAGEETTLDYGGYTDYFNL